MNAFNVLKYPVDERFVVEDLQRLPNDMLQEWWYNDLQWVSEPSITFVSAVLPTCTEEYHAKALQQLKDRIKNYDGV